MTYPRVLPLGEAALSVEFGDRIDAALNARVHALAATLAAAPLPGQIETVPSYRALLVAFDPDRADLAAARERLAELSVGPLGHTGPARRWRVPVVYGGAAGPDLDAIAAHAGLAPEVYAKRHAAGRYRVHMIGFQPGFCYLGGLDPVLAMPRRAEPRASIPARSISVGGMQTAIGTVAGPSGWHVIGCTPVRSFDIARDPVFLFGPGDGIELRRVGPDEAEALERTAAAGGLVAERLE